MKSDLNIEATAMFNSNSQFMSAQESAQESAQRKDWGAHDI